MIQRKRVKSINEFLFNLSNILQYVAPGILAIIIYKLLTAQKISIDSSTIVCGCIFSFVAINIGNFVFAPIPDNNHLIFYEIVFLIITSVGLAFLKKIPWVKKWFAKLFQVEFSNDTLFSVLESSNGAYVKIYTKNKEYNIKGHFYSQDEKYFAITGAIKIFKDGKESNNLKEELDEFYIIKKEDIDGIEVWKPNAKFKS